MNRRAGHVAVITLLTLGVAALLLSAGCSAEQQAASSADMLGRSLAQQSGQSAVTPQPAGSSGRVSANPSKQPSVPASLVEHGDRSGRKVVAIAVQMEAAPGHPGGLDQDILDTLHVDAVRATFFMAALWAQAHPQVAAQIGRDPAFEVGNGGYSSEYLSRLAPALVKERTARAQQTLERVAGDRPTTYRAAQTRYTPKSIAAIAAAGVRPVSGDIDITSPSPKLSAALIASQALARVRPGSIIVVRGDTQDPRIVRSLVFLLGGLKRAGYDNVTVSELIGLAPPSAGKRP